MNKQSLAGQRFGLLTVLEDSGQRNVRLERKKLFLKPKPTPKPCTHKSPCQTKEQGAKVNPKKRKRKAAKKSFKECISL